MQVSRSFRGTSVFVLKWEDADRLYSRLSVHFSTIKISASCADGLTRKFSDLEELRQFSNAKRVAIKSLEFESRGDRYEDRSSISFESDSTGNVRFSVDANEVFGTGLNTLYMDLLDSIRPWYARLAVFDFAIAVVVISVPTFVGLTLFAWLKGYLKAPNIGSGSAGDVAISLVGGVSIMAIAVLLNHFKAKFFPMGIFCLWRRLKAA